MKKRPDHIEMRCQNPQCGKLFHVAPWRIHAGHNVKFCSAACRASCHTGKAPKYIFTPEMDDLIRKVYGDQVGFSRRPVVRALAQKLGMPRWRVSRRAIELGCSVPQKKEPVWSDAELHILERFSHKHHRYIQKQLKKAGFQRTETGIILKRKRMRFLQNLDGMSCRQCAEFFGVDSHWITDKIEKKLLKAEKRQTARTEKQGGDIYYIKEKDIRQFIIDNPDLVDLRKVEKFYFIELLSKGGYIEVRRWNNRDLILI